MTGLGYRQRALLAVFPVARPVPTGYLVRRVAADPRTVNLALAGLQRRGLVRRVRHGWWEAS